MTTTETPTIWHHPHFVQCRPGGWHRTVYTFTPFTGDEPEPELPTAGWDLAEKVSKTSDRTALQVFTAMEDEVRAARTMWFAAKFRKQMTPLLQAAEPVHQAYRAARQQAEDLYRGLDKTENNKWKAALLRLTTARDAALEEAKRWDETAYPISETWEKTPERLEDNLPSPIALAAEIGVNTTGWELPDTYDYGYDRWSRKSPTVDKLQELFDTQDERIRKVADLTADNL